MLTVMSFLLLSESVNLFRWIGVIIGFWGMLFIVGQGLFTSETSNISIIGAMAALGSACMYAFYQISVRSLRQQVNSVDIMLQVSLVGFLILLIVMPWLWKTPSLEGFLVALLFTLIQTMAMVCIAEALKRGEASRLAPWEFSGLIWAMLLDIMFFNIYPSIVSLFGAGLIFCGGLLGLRSVYQKI